LNPQLFLSGNGFRPHASGEFGGESGYFCYMWPGNILNPERKSCGFKNIRIRVDGALKYTAHDARQTILHFKRGKKISRFSL